MVWLLKQVQPPARHQHSERQNFYVPPLCHLRRRSFLWSSYLGSYGEDILIRDCSAFGELLVGNSFRHIAEVGCSRKRRAFSTNPFKPPKSNLSKYDVLNAISSATARPRNSRDVEERERGPAFGRGARSSRLLRCSSYVHHSQNFFVIRAVNGLCEDAVRSKVYSRQQPITN